MNGIGQTGLFAPCQPLRPVLASAGRTGFCAPRVACVCVFLILAPFSQAAIRTDLTCGGSGERTIWTYGVPSPVELQSGSAPLQCARTRVLGKPDYSSLGGAAQAALLARRAAAARQVRGGGTIRALGANHTDLLAVHNPIRRDQWGASSCSLRARGYCEPPASPYMSSD